MAIAPSHWLFENSFPVPEAPLEDAEVAVIGGGIMGVSTAYWLARSGVGVRLVEANQLGWGASGRNAGLMLASPRPLENPELVSRVMREEAIDACYTTPGHLALASSELIWEKIRQETARNQRVHALDHLACEDLLHMRLSRRFIGGRWLPTGGLIHPTRFVNGLARAASRHGAAFTTHTRVLQVNATAGCDGFGVQTTRGALRARQIVFACNTTVRQFVPAFKHVIVPARGQVLSTQPLPRLFDVGMAVDWGTVYWRQAPDGAVILGGLRGHDPQPELSSRPYVNPRIQSALTAFLPDTFPDFPPFQVKQRWAGIMDGTPDDAPLVGVIPHRPNQFVIAGFGGHGLPVALGVGHALAETILTGRAPSEIEPFNPGRFVNRNY